MKSGFLHTLSPYHNIHLRAVVDNHSGKEIGLHSTTVKYVLYNIFGALHVFFSTLFDISLSSLIFMLILGLWLIMYSLGMGSQDYLDYLAYLCNITCIDIPAVQFPTSLSSQMQCIMAMEISVFETKVQSWVAIYYIEKEKLQTYENRCQWEVEYISSVKCGMCEVAGYFIRKCIFLLILKRKAYIHI